MQSVPRWRYGEIGATEKEIEVAQEMETVGAGVLRPLFNGSAKARADAELTLPDYKEDVNRVIRLDARPRLTKKEIYRDGANLCAALEGAVDFSVLYESEAREGGGKPTVILLHADFEHTFRIPASDGIGEETIAAVELTAENASVKLMGPRRLACRCDVAATLSLSANETLRFYDADAVFPPYYARKKEAEFTRLAACGREELSLSEVIRLPRDYPAAEEVSDAFATRVPLKTRAVAGGVAFEGLCAIHAVTADLEGNLNSFYQPVEFSATVSVPEAAEGMTALLELLPGAVRFSPETDETGENKSLRFEVDYTAEAALLTKETAACCADLYSVENEVETQEGAVSFERLLSASDALVSVRGECPAEEGDLRAENATGALEIRNFTPEGGVILVEAKLVLSYLATGAEGKTVSRRGEADLKFSVKPEGDLSAAGDAARVEITGNAVHCDVELKNGSAGIQADLFCRVRVYDAAEVSILSSVRTGESLPDPGRGVVFYYPDPNEGAWEIAKRYHVPPERIAGDFSDGRTPASVRILYA